MVCVRKRNSAYRRTYQKRWGTATFGFPVGSRYKFDSQGGRKFEEITGAHVGERLAILLDDVVQSTPNIIEKIPSGRAQIEGDFTSDEANFLAKILRAGAFPAGIRIVD